MPVSYSYMGHMQGLHLITHIGKHLGHDVSGCYVKWPLTQFSVLCNLAMYRCLKI